MGSELIGKHCVVEKLHCPDHAASLAVSKNPSHQVAENGSFENGFRSWRGTNKVLLTMKNRLRAKASKLISQSSGSVSQRVQVGLDNHMMVSSMVNAEPYGSGKLALSIAVFPILLTLTGLTCLAQQPELPRPPHQTHRRYNASFFSNGLAMKPPMGWSSWNNYRLDITESEIRDAADAMVSSGLKDAGYEYVDIDSGWFFNKRDVSGNMIADENRFPHGMKALADYIHSKGLKAGIYTDVGEKGCGEGGSSPQHYRQDARLFAEWGYDLVKVDSCGAKKDEPTMRSLYTQFSHAMLAAPRPMVYSICSQGEGEPWLWAAREGNYWRVGHDVDYYNWTNPANNYLWQGVLYEFDRASSHPDIAGLGHWNDPDMLPVGGVKQGHSPQPGGQSLTNDEEKSLMSMWSMLSAPLIAGANLPTIPASSLQVLLNQEVIAVDQDAAGIQAHLVEEQGPGLQIWEKPLRAVGGRRCAILMLNRTEYVQKITYHTADATHDRTFAVRDLWAHSNAGSDLKEYTATIQPHGVSMLALTWNPGAQSK